MQRVACWRYGTRDAAEKLLLYPEGGEAGEALGDGLGAGVGDGVVGQVEQLLGVLIWSSGSCSSPIGVAAAAVFVLKLQRPCSC